MNTNTIATSNGLAMKYCENCSMPIEYCSFNDKKTYKKCLQFLAKNNPKQAEKLVLTTTAPIISITKCGISRINGIYKRKSKTEPFTYIHASNPTLCIIRTDIHQLSLTTVWIIAEKSCIIHSNFIIHHYINKAMSLHPPIKKWGCIAGIYPLPALKHIEQTLFNKTTLSIEHQKTNGYLIKLWRAYPKIPNLMQTLFIKQLNDNGYTKNDVRWVATEKVHGSNLSLISDGKYVIAAKRTSVLMPQEAFYKGWQCVVDKEKPRIIKCFEYIEQHIDASVIGIIVYGELFGGTLSMNSDQKKYVQIQKGVDYSPKHHFYPFDVFITTDDEHKSDVCIDIESDGYFLSWDKMMELCKYCAFEVYAAGIIEGNLQEIIREFDPNTFETTIPGKLGLSKPLNNYVAEGVVIRTKYGKRICVKYKADRFGEIDVGMQSQMKRDISLPMSLKDVEKGVLHIFGGDEEMVNLIYRCINENRLNSVSSKIGAMNKANYNKIVGNFTGDVWTEINTLCGDKMKNIPDSDTVTIRKFITECIRQFVSKQVHLI